MSIITSPLPTCMITGSDALLKNTQDAMYTSILANIYQWSIQSGDAIIDGVSNAQNVTIDFGVDTSVLQLIVTNTDGCRDTCEMTILPLSFDLALKKEVLTPGPFQGGDDVTFEITVYNQGSFDASNVVIHDYIPTGLTLNDNSWNEVSPQVAEDNIAFLGREDSTKLYITLRIYSSFAGQLINLSLIHISEPTRPY